ncbi:MAG: hypothetical protein WCY41_05860 [Candidatus Micrarchaeia archaeon]
MIQMALQQASIGGNVGSVGAAWPPAFDAGNARIKGFCPSVITSRNGLFQDAFAHANNARRAHPEATRVTFRAFVRRGLLEGISRSCGKMEFSVEAVVPADNAVPGFDMVYFGRNESVRTPPEKLRRKENESLEGIRSTVARANPSEAIERVESGGYQISMPENGSVHNEQDIRTLLNLYKEAYQQYTFPINETTIQVMVGNGNRVVVARDAGGQIASALIAEECELGLGNGMRVKLYELSDFATFEKHSGKGLMTALQIEAVKLIRSLPGGEKAIIYSEDRAPWSWVNKSSHKAGMEFAGTLPWPCAMMARRDVQYTGKYESLNVWYA